MANIASALQPMNDVELSDDAPITTATMYKIGANINALASGLSYTEFNSNTSWTAPSNCFRALLIGCGGGGGVGTTQGASYYAGGGSAPLSARFVELTPGTVYTITIGTGGGGNGDGAATTFASGSTTLVSFVGGAHGVSSQSAGVPGPFGGAGVANSGSGGYYSSGSYPGSTGKVILAYLLTSA